MEIVRETITSSGRMLKDKALASSIFPRRRDGVSPEWRLDKAQNFRAEAFATSDSGNGLEQDLV